MIDDIIETYRCLISCREKMPGMKLEDAFSAKAIADIKKEYGWLLKQSFHQADPADAKEPCAHEWIGLYGHPAAFECRKCGALRR